MLYWPKELAARIHQIGRRLERGKLSLAEGARELIAAAPDNEIAILLQTQTLRESGKLAEAEDLLWTGLRSCPCSSEMYFSLASIIMELRPKDPAGDQVALHGWWRLGFSEGINPENTERLEEAIAEFGDPEDPLTYRTMASVIERQKRSRKKDPRLLPLELFTRLQREAEEGMESKTLADVLSHPAEYEPLLFGALRQWANGRTEYSPLLPSALCAFIAILGEIGGPERIADLLELAAIDQKNVFLHVHWAIWRLAQRFPADALKSFRVAIPGSSLPLRCALAEHLGLMPRIEGVGDALAALLNGFSKFAGQHDAPYLAAIVTHNMAEEGQVEQAHAALSQCRAALGGADVDLLDKLVDSDEPPTTTLEEEQIPTLDIDDLCIGQALMDDPDDDEEDFDEEDFDEEDLEEEDVDKEDFDENDPFGDTLKEGEIVEPEDEPLPLRVLRTLERWHSKADSKRASRMFLGDSHGSEMGAEEFDLFAQFLTHDFRDQATGKTLIEHYLEAPPAELSREERAELEAMRDSRFGLYEILRLEKDRGVHLRDVFGGQTYFVEDRTSSRQSRKGDLALLRIRFLEGHYSLGGNGTVVPRELLEELRSFVRTKSRAAGQSESEFASANSHLFHRQVYEWHARRLRDLKVVDHVGDQVEFCTGRYEILSSEALLNKLHAMPELSLQKSTDSVKRFTWLESGDGPRRVLGSIAITPSELRLETTSRRQLELGRGLLEFNAGPELRYLGDDSTTVDDIKRQVRAGKKSPPLLPPSFEEKQIVLDFKEQHYANWPDHELPALNGRTPRQAIKTKAGRKAVATLLDSMEANEMRAASLDGPAYDFGKLRRVLGLEED